MLRAPVEGKPPREVAAALAEELKERLGDDVERIDVAGPGFLNLFMSERWFHRAVAAAASSRATTSGAAAGASGCSSSS